MRIVVLDDSGSDRQGSAIVLAGYAATSEAWETFSSAWRQVLDESPPIACFRMKKANRRMAQGRLLRFVSAIEANVELGITSCIFNDDLNAVKPDFGDFILQPYDLLFHGTMAVTVDYYLRHLPDEKIEFVFDEQGALGRTALRFFDNIHQFLTEKERGAIASRPVHESDRRYLPLQAADLIAWQTKRFIEENKHFPPTSAINQYVVNSPVLQRLEKISTLYNTYGVSRLQRIARDTRIASSSPWQK